MKKTNKKIKNAQVCQSDNLLFKSQLEKSVYSTLQQLGFNPKYEPETHTLWKGFDPITPFYDKETDTQHKKRLEKGDTNKSKILVHKEGKITGIRYTPDFYFRYKNLDVYIETKGFENDVFYIKKKMFRHFLDERFLATGQHSIFFEIYTKKQLLQSIQIIKDYGKSIEESGGISSYPSRERCQDSKEVS